MLQVFQVQTDIRASVYATHSGDEGHCLVWLDGGDEFSPPWYYTKSNLFCGAGRQPADRMSSGPFSAVKLPFTTLAREFSHQRMSPPIHVVAGNAASAIAISSSG
jgi:hypothetical protein